MTKLTWWVAASVSLAVGLSACGGGGDDSPPAPAVTAEVPAAASVSINGFIGYLKELVVASADMLEPVDVSSVTPPLVETEDPVTVE